MHLPPDAALGEIGNTFLMFLSYTLFYVFYLRNDSTSKPNTTYFWCAS
jgi:hypothetical protein